MSELSQKARTRERILDEAARAMREHGCEGIGVAALMKRAGLTHGGFYAHFENRDTLVAEAIARMFEDSARMLDGHLKHGDVAAGLARLIDRYLSEEALLKRDRGCAMPGLSGEASRLPPAARERFAAGVENFRAALQTALETLGRPDPATLAASVLAEMVGAMSLARALEGSAGVQMLAACRNRLMLRLDLGARGEGAGER